MVTRSAAGRGYSGRCRPIVSVNESLPCSANCTIAAAVNDLPIDPMLNLVSRQLAYPCSRSAHPDAYEKSGRYCSVTSTAPENASASVRVFMYARSMSEMVEGDATGAAGDDDIR